MVSTVELVCVPVIRLKSWDIIRYWIWLWAVQGTLFTVSLRSQTQPWSVLVMRSWSSKNCFFLFGLTLLRNGTGGLFSSPCLTLDPHCPPYTCPLLLSQLWKPLDQVFQRAALTQPPHKATGACGKIVLGNVFTDVKKQSSALSNLTHSVIEGLWGVFERSGGGRCVNLLGLQWEKHRLSVA